MGEGINLEKLNLRKITTFDYSNEAGTEDQRIHFYCISEGATEESCFYGIRNNKKELHIKNEVHIHVVEKEEGQETYSHPMQLVKACLVQMGYMDENGNELPESEWAKNCRWDDYDRSIDQVCVIFDRDYRNLEFCLNEIFDLCNKYGVKIVMSNPNFELWLLMHFPNIEKYDREEIRENRKNLRYQIADDASKNKKFLEIEVARNANGYTKGSSIKFEAFLPQIDLAVEQAKLFCEESDLLIDEIGTSVGKLIEEIRA